MRQLFIPTASDIIVQNAFSFFFSFVVVPRMFEYYIDVYLCALFLEFTRVQAEVGVVGVGGWGEVWIQHCVICECCESPEVRR